MTIKVTFYQIISFTLCLHQKTSGMLWNLIQWSSEKVQSEFYLLPVIPLNMCHVVAWDNDLRYTGIFPERDDR